MEWNVLQVAVQAIIDELEDVLTFDYEDELWIIEARLAAAKRLKERLDAEFS